MLDRNRPSAWNRPVLRFVTTAVVLLAALLPSPAWAQESPMVVRVGAYINDVQQLDLQTHSYAVDMYIWFRWCGGDGRDPSRTFEFLNSYELWGHILTYETEEPEPRGGNCFFQGLRNQGKFNTKLPLADYPFDEQELTVEFEDSGLDESGLRYIADDGAVATNPQMTLPGYNIGQPDLEVVSYPYATRFGERAGPFPTYSRARVVLGVTRPAGTYAVKLLLPIIIVLMSAGLMFIVRPDFVEGRIGIGITALLTLVALQLTTNSALPDVNYLLMIDKIYIASYAFIVTSLGLVARTSWLAGDGTLGRAITFDRRSLVAVASGYVLALGVIVALQLL